MENISFHIFIYIILFGVIVLLIISFISLLNSEQNKRKKLLNEKRKMINQISELNKTKALIETEHLKFQLKPHTLINILSNLKVIAGKLNKGMDILSDTLDYILYQGNTHLVSVEDEINFIRKYLKLNNIFTTSIDAIKIDTSNIDMNSTFYRENCIPHLITGYFLENAFKHGDTEHPDFLNVRIILTDTFFEMIVTNRTKRQIMHSNNGGLGLVNMRKRLDLLLKDKYEMQSRQNGTAFHSTLKINFEQKTANTKT